MLSPIRFAHSSTSLTVPERSRREGRLFACHSEPIRSTQGELREECLSFLAQGKLREASAFRIENKELRFYSRPSTSLRAVSLSNGGCGIRMTRPKPFFSDLLKVATQSVSASAIELGPDEVEISPSGLCGRKPGWR